MSGLSHNVIKLITKLRVSRGWKEQTAPPTFHTSKMPIPKTSPVRLIVTVH